MSLLTYSLKLPLLLPPSTVVHLLLMPVWLLRVVLAPLLLCLSTAVHLLLLRARLLLVLQGWFLWLLLGIHLQGSLRLLPSHGCLDTTLQTLLACSKHSPMNAGSTHLTCPTENLSLPYTEPICPFKGNKNHHLEYDLPNACSNS